MSVARYRRFLKLCEEWPRDESKKGRDLGTFLRQRVTHAFREGENTQLSDPEKCDQIYESLARINTNVYRERFPRTRDTSFTGVTVEECRMLLATGNMQQMNEKKKGLWKTLTERFSTKQDVTPEKAPENK
ncbi:ubiquinol-cytochrome-c reductase complex assembly factor 2-like [Oncorhynchus kisutch]|uniref:Mitochondrial nucleoid factor 1 n=1 Tax=Oncorhynchus kisutch TaxID=8019 RepID=A0A8C7CP33_ONCKI|nr:ubiquinol-cytochrome-c reductase complex assembly factor 2-like [Oncorhynchus kisutch]